MSFRCVALVVSCLIVPAQVQAQAGGGLPAARGPGATEAQELTFTDQLVTSELPRPDLTTVRGGLRPAGGSLIRTRSQFVREMFKSVENL